MGIQIYTYANPYNMEDEDYWPLIKNAPHFCVSQTLANGFMDCYEYLRYNCNITTVRNLINSLYSKWDSNEIRVAQMIAVDNAISHLEINGAHPDSIRKSLLNNTKSIANCIRIFVELNLNPYDFSTKNINIDQQYLVKIYKIIFDSKPFAFKFDSNLTNDKIDKAVTKTLKELEKNDSQGKSKFNAGAIDFNTIVFNGIHQFSPDILTTIFEMSKFKNVVLLFNYQQQYNEVYKTWMRIYENFKRPIKFSSVDELVPNVLLSKDGNYLADYIGKIINCEDFDMDNCLKNIKLIEFDNLTEFANYCANVYQKADRYRIKMNSQNSPLKFMDEQFYSASTKVNDILRAYFPEQFGERHFLDYPLGHFFVAAINLWNSEEAKIKVLNYSDIKECLNSGILIESRSGLLINTFNRVLPYIDDLDDLDKIISKLNKLGRTLTTPTKVKVYIGYLNVDRDDLVQLINALTDLKEIIIFFFKDFTNGIDNFKKFYEKIRKFITSRLDSNKDFDKDMMEVVKQLLNKLEETDLPSTGSFITLRQTMNYYLSQNDQVNYGAKWIVRGFEQIDGDVLIKHGGPHDNIHKNGITYHFACLSDANILASKDERLPWPLDIDFFESIVIPTDLKHQIFLTSKSEYHNFNRYALLYGLQFNRQNVQLSYIKSENNKENDLFYALSLLNLKPKKYNGHDFSGYKPMVQYKNESVDLNLYFNNLREIEKIKYKICPYKFKMENVVQKNAIHRDRFLIHMFMRVFVENKIKKEMQGLEYNSERIKTKISECIDELNYELNIINPLEKAELCSAIRNSIVNCAVKNNRFLTLSSKDINSNTYKEELLYMKYDNDKKIDFEQFIKDLESENIKVNSDSYCKYCSTKDICLAKMK